jgi:transcriptional regulator with XRE-family HTH domain
MRLAVELSNYRGRATDGQMFTPLQLRAARVFAGWSREDLAEASGTATETVQGFEARGSDPKRSTLIAWRNALAKAGVEFTEETDEHGAGVRLRKRR